MKHIPACVSNDTDGGAQISSDVGSNYLLLEVDAVLFGSLWNQPPLGALEQEEGFSGDSLVNS